MKLFTTLALIAIALTTVGQNNDAKATALLDEVSKKTKSYKTIRADFSYTMVNAKAGINEEKGGTLWLSGDKYKMTASGQTVISDGKTVWTYIKESNEVQVNTLDNKDDALTPSKLLTSYNDNYRSKIIKSTDPAIEQIEMIPTKSKTFTKAILAIDKAKKQVKRFTLFDKSGNTFTYQIKTFVTDGPVSPGEFTFDPSKYPGVEIIDMR